MNNLSGLLESLSVLTAAKQIRDVEHCFEPRVTVLRPHADVAWGGLCRLLSTQLGGQWWEGAASATWRYGQDTHWLVSPALLSEVYEARRIVRELTEEEDPPWNVASCGRRLLDWVGFRQEQWRGAEILRKGLSWHYHRCVPTLGRQRLPYGYLFDVESCYYSLARLLPSPVLSPRPGGKIVWHPLTSEQDDRWRKMLLAIRGHKRLRNALLGCAYGGKGRSYVRGRGRQGKFRPGPLPTAALLIVRSAYELCALAAQRSRALYSNTDCVISESPEPPAPWVDAGLSVRLQSEGETDVCSLGVYRVGDKATKWYWRGERRFAESVAVARIEGPEWAEWVYEKEDPR